MPSPIGHLIAGYVVHAMMRPQVAAQSRERYVLVGALFSAFAADLDFLPGIVIGAPNYFHHGPSHSLGAVLLYGMGIWVILRLCKVAQPLPLALLFASAYASHLVLDMLAVDTSPPFGIPLFWPVTKTYFISPAPLFTDIRRGDGAALTFIRSGLNAHNMFAVIWEMVLLGPMAVWLHQQKRSALLAKEGG